MGHESLRYSLERNVEARTAEAVADGPGVKKARTGARSGRGGEVVGHSGVDRQEAREQGGE